MEAQVKRFGVEIVQMDVARIEKYDGKFRVELGSGKEVIAEAVVVATGCRQKRLGIPGEAKLFGKGVSYCATCDGFFFKNQDVAVIGGGDSAVQEALYLSHVCRKVFIIHRRDQLRAKKLHQDRAMAKPNIEIVWDTIPEAVLGEKEVEGLLLKNVKTDEKRELAVKGIFFYVGLDPINEMFLGLMQLTDDGFIRAGEDTRTNVPGVFAVGDIRRKTTRQIASAVADGCQAAYAIEEYFLEKE